MNEPTPVHRILSLIAALLLAFISPVRAADVATLLPTKWNPRAVADEVLARLVRVSAPQVKGAHDAEFVCVGDRAYVVEHDNDVAPGHGAGKAMYCVLTVVNLKTLEVEKTHLLSKAGQAFTNVTLPDAEMFVPRIIRKDEHTLRCYFCSQPAKEQAVTWYRDFDLRTQAFADSIHKAKLKTATGVFDMEPRPFVPNGLNSKPTFDRFGGVYYLGWQENTKVGECSRSVFNVDVSLDGTTWERKYRFESPHSFQYPTFHEHEGAIWLAVTQSDHKGSTDRIMFGRLEDVGRGAPQAAQGAASANFDPARRLWQGIPGLERTAKGRLSMSWFTGGPKEPAPGNTVVLSRSDDGGRTFTVPEPLGLPHADGTRCYDPCLWIDPRGRLWYFFNRGNRQTATHSVVARVCDDPDAAQPVFGPEIRIGFDVPFAFRMNKPTTLSTGEWVLPVTHAAVTVPAWSTGYTDKQTPLVHGVAISTDEGRTWRLHGAVSAPPWPLENMIVELKDGRLWMLIRTSSGVLWQSHSSDKGRTWTPGWPSTIKSPGSRFFVRRLASGNLLLVNHYNFIGRNNLTAQRSTDDGVTWNEGLLLDERASVSYPDGVQDKDGLVWITYDRDRQSTGEILLAKFREEDVAAGRDVSGKVSLRQVVNRLEKPGELAAVIAADEARVAAFKKPTAETLERIFSADLHYAHSTGVVDTKPSFIDVLTSGKTKYVGIDYEDREFSFPAPGIALMTGRVRVQAVTAEATLDNLLSFLAVWRLEEGRWRFLSWQSCRMTGAPAKPPHPGR